ncbi:hypothetical protein JCM8547_000812 [Rhodosporidiobolus lusitaniae]
MGALCGKEDHFDNLGKGNTLGASTTANKPSSTSPPPPTSATPSQGYSVASKSASTSPPQRLGGSGALPPTGADAERREAMLRAAEVRNQAAVTRGMTAGGGKIASQLASQGKDGGRAAEARLEAERRGELIVWD